MKILSPISTSKKTVGVNGEWRASGHWSFNDQLYQIFFTWFPVTVGFLDFHTEPPRGTSRAIRLTPSQFYRIGA